MIIEPQPNLVLSVTEHRTNFQMQPAGRIGLLALATINVTTVVSLGGLPSEAKHALQTTKIPFPPRHPALTDP